jgi:hypothetical protein
MFRSYKLIISKDKFKNQDFFREGNILSYIDDFKNHYFRRLKIS